MQVVYPCIFLQWRLRLNSLFSSMTYNRCNPPSPTFFMREIFSQGWGGANACASIILMYFLQWKLRLNSLFSSMTYYCYNTPVNFIFCQGNLFTRVKGGNANASSILGDFLRWRLCLNCPFSAGMLSPPPPPPQKSSFEQPTSYVHLLHAKWRIQGWFLAWVSYHATVKFHSCLASAKLFRDFQWWGGVRKLQFLSSGPCGTACENFYQNNFFGKSH